VKILPRVYYIFKHAINAIWAIPLVIIMRIIYPFILIRVGTFNTQRVGHFVLDAAHHFIKQHNCEAYGCDISKEALLEAGIRAKKLNSSVNFTECSFDNLDYNDSEFDAVFCEGVLYYGSERAFNDGIHEMYRVLRKNGILRVYTKSSNDVWANSKNRISDDTYLVEKGYEKGMTVYCPPLDKINNSFGMFDNVKIGIEEFNYVGLENLKSFWVITAIK